MFKVATLQCAGKYPTNEQFKRDILAVKLKAEQGFLSALTRFQQVPLLHFQPLYLKTSIAELRREMYALWKVPHAVHINTKNISDDGDTGRGEPEGRNNQDCDCILFLEDKQNLEWIFTTTPVMKAS